MRPPGAGRYSASGPKVDLTTDATTPLALILHELATNALKYGAWSNDVGRVELAWKSAAANGDARMIEFVWRETEGPEVAAPNRSGFGSILIDKTFPGAKVERSLEPGGATCRIVFAAS